MPLSPLSLKACQLALLLLLPATARRGAEEALQGAADLESTSDLLAALKPDSPSLVADSQQLLGECLSAKILAAGEKLAKEAAQSVSEDAVTDIKAQFADFSAGAPAIQKLDDCFTQVGEECANDKGTCYDMVQQPDKLAKFATDCMGMDAIKHKLESIHAPPKLWLESKSSLKSQTCACAKSVLKIKIMEGPGAGMPDMVDHLVKCPEDMPPEEVEGPKDFNDEDDVVSNVDCAKLKNTKNRLQVQDRVYPFRTRSTLKRMRFKKKLKIENLQQQQDEDKDANEKYEDCMAGMLDEEEMKKLAAMK